MKIRDEQQAAKVDWTGQQLASACSLIFNHHHRLLNIFHCYNTVSLLWIHFQISRSNNKTKKFIPGLSDSHFLRFSVTFYIQPFVGEITLNVLCRFFNPQNLLLHHCHVVLNAFLQTMLLMAFIKLRPTSFNHAKRWPRIVQEHRLLPLHRHSSSVLRHQAFPSALVNN